MRWEKGLILGLVDINGTNSVVEICYLLPFREFQLAMEIAGVCIGNRDFCVKCESKPYSNYKK